MGHGDRRLAARATSGNRTKSPVFRNVLHMEEEKV